MVILLYKGQRFDFDVVITLEKNKPVSRDCKEDLPEEMKH